MPLPRAAQEVAVRCRCEKHNGSETFCCSHACVDDALIQQGRLSESRQRRHPCSKNKAIWGSVSPRNTTTVTMDSKTPHSAETQFIFLLDVKCLKNMCKYKTRNGTAFITRCEIERNRVFQEYSWCKYAFVHPNRHFICLSFLGGLFPFHLRKDQRMLKTMYILFKHQT